MKSRKHIVTLLLCIVMVLGILPVCALAASKTSQNESSYSLAQFYEGLPFRQNPAAPADNATNSTNAAGLSLSELQAKFPAGKYWNHVGSSSNNPDGYTSEPCPSHSSASATCNAFVCDGIEIGRQCFGFACKLGFDAYGVNPKSWERAFSLDNIKPGDIINYDGISPGHTVFVIAVDGDTVSFAECNYSGRCLIRWDRSLKKSQFNNLYNVYVAPYALPTDAVHVHDFSSSRDEFDAEHPHRIFRRCACGEIEYTNSYRVVDNCEQCYPRDHLISGEFYCIYEDGTERLIPSGECMFWNSKNYMTYYADIKNGNLPHDFKLPSGTYSLTVRCTAENEDDNCLGEWDQTIVIESDTNLGLIKLLFTFFKHKINVLDSVTHQELDHFNWELWKDGSLIFSDDYLCYYNLRAGSTYTLKIHKDGYLDFSAEIRSFIGSENARATTYAYLQPTQGDCGNGVWWKLEDHTLTFGGSGPIPDYSSVPPWGPLGTDGLVHHVEILPGITRIGDRTMYGQWRHEGITVSIPNTVTAIGEEAMSFTQMRYVEIPEQVTSIGDGAFDSSNHLTVKFLGDAPTFSSLPSSSGRVFLAFARATDITILYPASNRTWDSLVGQNLGAENDITWIPYGDNTQTPPSGTAPVTPQQAASSPAYSFTDVSKNAYYADAVIWAVENGITSGTDAEHFSPNQVCTRAQMVTFLWRAAGSPMPTGKGASFADVSSSAYYYHAVLWAIEQGITNGLTVKHFAPNTALTRAQAVTFLARLANAHKSFAENPFSDIADQAYYADAVLWALENGITNGTSHTTFSPENNCTRAQIVAFLYRYFAE